MLEPSRSRDPLVSVVLTSHNRRDLVPIVLECYRRQTYPNRELLVVDDSDTPLDSAAVDAVGGTLLRMEPGTPLGVKENHGIAQAKGRYIQRMDDDDYYAPTFMQHMVDGYREYARELCRPAVGGLCKQLFFDVRRWELRRSPWLFISGNTYFFARADWQECPYRPITRGEDLWLLQDLKHMDIDALRIPGMDHLVQIRHGAHVWNDLSGEPLADVMQEWPSHPAPIEALVPEWAVSVYARIRQRLLAAS